MSSYIIASGDLCHQLIISNIIISCEECFRENPYNTSFLVKVVSGEFTGISEFICNVKDFIKFIIEIRDLYHGKIGQVELVDQRNCSRVKFCINKCHLTVSGTLYSRHKGQCLVFCFNTDQTSLELCCKYLNRDFVVGNKYFTFD